MVCYCHPLKWRSIAGHIGREKQSIYVVLSLYFFISSRSYLSVRMKCGHHLSTRTSYFPGIVKMEQLKKSSIHAIFVGMWVSCLAEAFYYFLLI